jgi:mercuric ion binding protein
MKITRLIAVLLVAPLAILAGDLRIVVLDMQNMTCPMCSITVQKSLEKVTGVTGAKIDYDRKTATVKFDPDKASTAALVKATTDAGFPARLHGAAKP